MSRLLTLIVHPDPAVREAVRRALAPAEYLQVLGEAASLDEAFSLLEHVPYGAVFTGLDIDASGAGFELARKLAGRKNKPAVVYLAEEESRAFEAFELGAMDYILWPCSAERLARTMDKLRQFKAHFKLVPPPDGVSESGYDPELNGEDERTLQLDLGEEEQEHFLTALRQAWDYTRRVAPVELEKLAVTLEGRTILIPYTKVIFVEAVEDYTYVHTSQEKYLTSYRLKNLEERLKPHRFFRVHRKYLVNLDMVTEIASLPGSNFMLRTAGKTRIELPISRRRINDLKQMLGL
ncbi:DNA-binding response regulator [Oceanidesulfovibrio indonesiensis]|uniref:DNA-binding response regulator n=1 Tax=Oceanidesulfovibrio indonesiensis TaxID=54767 RepID=A0A7M3MB30_9BACT|nr:LytTR family DNA-binding domain-containing protein [Oceanidesulfovibrio indonesiensis]TVM15193.1 DNA-binding response regulator [Oceanidesulfovibrio indonesiensis]